MRIPIVTLSLLLCAGCVSQPVDTFAPAGLWRAQAYEGPPRRQEEVATVFAMDGRPNYESSYICAAAGIRLERNGGCASVIYLLPGEHAVALTYRSPIERGDGTLRMRVEAGKTYQLNFTSLRTRQTGIIQVMPMPQSFRLTYRTLAPGLSVGSPRADEAVPYGANEGV